jgi:hypothetical protein
MSVLLSFHLARCVSNVHYSGVMSTGNTVGSPDYKL